MDIDDAVNELHTLADWVRWGASELNRAGVFMGHGTDNASDEISHLAYYVMNLPLDNPLPIEQCRLTKVERRALISLIQRRVEERIPVPYLTKEGWFCGLAFNVDERVLVPRSPIGQLIEAEFSPWLDEIEPQRILDLCTGSGCIGIATALTFTDAQVDLLDLSADALVVANTNIEKYELSDRVKTIESNLFEKCEATYDLIVSNPPYVDEADLSSMPKEFHAEPALGLGSGVDGLDITREILRSARKHLTNEGILIVEVGNSEVALQASFPDVPFLWIEFEEGGHGVFMLTAEQLDEYADQF